MKTANVYAFVNAKRSSLRRISNELLTRLLHEITCSGLCQQKGGKSCGLVRKIARYCNLLLLKKFLFRIPSLYVSSVFSFQGESPSWFPYEQSSGVLKMANQKSKSEIRKYDGNNKLFSVAASLAKIPATYRQYRKWEQGRGAAFNKKGEAQASLNT